MPACRCVGDVQAIQVVQKTSSAQKHDNGIIGYGPCAHVLQFRAKERAASTNLQRSVMSHGLTLGADSSELVMQKCTDLSALLESGQCLTEQNA